MEPTPTLSALTPDISQYFRDQLRLARASILKDSEAFELAVVVFERIGKWLNPAASGLGKVRKELGQVADLSVLSQVVPAASSSLHLSYEALFELIRDGRNAAVHEGALARHVTAHCVELALILEDALMARTNTVGEFMVRSPLTATPWFPISYVRQIMMANAFSFLPVRMSDNEVRDWLVVSDTAIANFLGPQRGEDRDRRLRQSLEGAWRSGSLKLEQPRCVTPNFLAAELKDSISATPILVTDPASKELIGILTAFDLL